MGRRELPSQEGKEGLEALCEHVSQPPTSSWSSTDLPYTCPIHGSMHVTCIPYMSLAHGSGTAPSQLIGGMLQESIPKEGLRGGGGKTHAADERV